MGFVDERAIRREWGDTCIDNIGVIVIPPLQRFKLLSIKRHYGIYEFEGLHLPASQNDKRGLDAFSKRGVVLLDERLEITIVHLLDRNFYRIRRTREPLAQLSSLNNSRQSRSRGTEN